MEEVERLASLQALSNLEGGKVLLQELNNDIILNVETILYNYDKEGFRLMEKIAETKAKYEILDKIVGSENKLKSLKRELKEALE